MNKKEILRHSDHALTGTTVTWNQFKTAEEEAAEMGKREILRHIDHTLLATTSTWEQIKNLVEEAAKYDMATACIPPCYVYKAHWYNPQVRICTVIGFPNGYNNASVKVTEARQALKDGAAEIDMVINVAALKSGDVYTVRDEIKQIRQVCDEVTPHAVLKVIVETCLLSDSEKRLMCNICAETGADFIKTSTGFAEGGADRHSVCVMANEIRSNHLRLKIKAAGGIRSLEEAEWYIEHGCERIGTSSALKM